MLIARRIRPGLTPSRTQPRAPARIAANNDLSSSTIDRISTPISGWVRTIRWVAWIPLPTGVAMSISTTSGRSRSAVSQLVKSRD
jgi:hypothetical protein